MILSTLPKLLIVAYAVAALPESVVYPFVAVFKSIFLTVIFDIIRCSSKSWTVKNRILPLELAVVVSIFIL